MRMRIISFASMLRQEIGWFDREENTIGALVTQLSSDTSNLKVKKKDNFVKQSKDLVF
jgi:ATP-binding cassette subfamily B (MDR/TAP) protein 1